MLSFRTRITLALVLPLLFTLTVILLALSLPHTPMTFSADDLLSR